MADRRPVVAIVVKGYPRLSETFIAQEIDGLEQRGMRLAIVSLRHPTDRLRHPLHDRIRAPVRYLPEYLHQEPLRVLRGWWRSRRRAGYGRALAAWLRDLARDRSRNRVRRFGQALVLAAELDPDVAWLHAHFLHTPASVARYAALLTGLPWSGSAHARDIWTSPDWELAEKLAECQWLVTCTGAGRDRLAALAPQADTVELVHHGIDLARFPPPPPRPPRDGRDADPVRLLMVGRLVEKKGADVLLAALALLPAGLQWRLQVIGGGPLGPALKAEAERLGVTERITWTGAQAQPAVLAAYRAADLFVLASRIDRDGDRDGIPNVLMEAQSQALACVSTAVSAIPEIIDDGATGRLVPPEDPAALAAALADLIADPALRQRLGAAARARIERAFRHDAGLDRLAGRFAEAGLVPARVPA